MGQCQENARQRVAVIYQGADDEALQKLLPGRKTHDLDNVICSYPKAIWEDDVA